ncbi:MAG: hypothetical protein QNK23_13000 [Crocinitomicaceae bacterium]|nr:hypothetical protein [Crocinitomicaceae bacterium]
MKKEELPQDKSALENFTREVCYVKNKDGKYETDLSTGWETKKIALDKAWEEIDRRVEEAKQKVLNDKASPVLYYLELKLMDLPVLAGYTGFRSWQIKRHMKPSVFKKLSDKKLQVYADVFEVTLEDFKNFNT